MSAKGVETPLLEHMGRSVPLIALLVSVCALAGARQAEAAKCGAVDPATKTTARATLALDEKSAVTSQIFKRKTAKRSLSLIFTASGCDIDVLEPAPRPTQLPQKGMDELPEGAWTVKSAEFDSPTLEVILTVDPKKFPPGSYGNLLSLRAGYLAANRTPIAVSRSEDTPWKPIGIGALAGLAGFLWFAVLKFVARAKLKVSWWWLPLVAGLAVAVGAWGAAKSYWDQDVWTFDANWHATAVAGFTGASTGSILALLGTVWGAPKK
jgi:hypothetical protein